MSDANTYIANADEVRGTAALLNQIEKAARQMLDDFRAGVSETAGWEGQNDSYAKSVKKDVAKQDSAATTATASVADAVAGITNGTVANADNITRTQAGNLDAIRQAGAASGDTGHRH